MITQNFNTTDIPLNMYLKYASIIELTIITSSIIILILMHIKNKYYILNSPTKIKTLVKTIIITAIVLLTGTIYQYINIKKIYVEKYGNETINLLTIKDKIKVENNTVTIDKLPNHLKYKPFDTGTYDMIPQYIVINNLTYISNTATKNYIYLDKDAKQTFYISDNPNIPTLYNQEGYIYLMSPAEFEMIKSLKIK